MPPSSPVAARRELSRRIRLRRRDLGRSADDVSDKLGISRVYLSALENGRAVMAEAKLAELIAELGFDEKEASELTSLLASARQSGWWKDYADVLNESFLEFIGLEHAATSARIYESRLVTGLLQTRDYATEVVRASPSVSLGELQRVVEARLRRKERLIEEPKLQLQVIFAQAAIMQRFGSTDILRDQLSHIVEMVQRSEGGIDFRIQPFDMTPLGLAAANTVVILKFDRELLPDIAWIEAWDILHLEDDRSMLADLSLNFDQTLESCLSHSQSMDLLKSRIEDLSSIGSS